MKKKVMILTVIPLVAFTLTLNAEELVDASKIKVKKIADEITDLRSELAASLIHSDQTVTPELFKSVCGAVKMRAMEIVKKEGVKIRHAAVKNRNPGHAATSEEKSLHRYFTEQPDETGLWKDTDFKGKKYKMYVRPIYVEPACLACHGEKAKRPAFIKKKYPQDKAFDFKVGDLRGIIKVMVPE